MCTNEEMMEKIITHNEMRALLRRDWAMNALGYDPHEGGGEPSFQSDEHKAIYDNRFEHVPVIV